MRTKLEVFALFTLLAGGFSVSQADVSSSYYYNMYTTENHHVDNNGIPDLKSTRKSSSQFSTGSRTGWQESNGFGYMIPDDWQGASRSRIDLDVNSDQAILKARVTASATASNGGTPSAYAELRMGVRQYYRAEGGASMTLRLSFHYDGNWNDGGNDNSARVALGTYLTRVNDENTFFAGGVEAEHPLNIIDFTDFPPGLSFYDAYFGQGQNVADTLGHHIYFSTKDKYLPNGALDYDYSFDVTIQPGELILVDTMFDAKVKAHRENNGTTSAQIDFLNTTYSSVEIVNGSGSLVPQPMPVSIPEPSAIILLIIGAIGFFGIIRPQF